MIFTASSKIMSFPIDINRLHFPPSLASNFAQERKTRFLAVRNFDFFAGDSCRRRLVLLSLDSSDQRRQLLEFKVVTMSSESEGDEPGSNSGNGSHFEPHSHHVTPITPLTQVAPGMMMGQTNVSMQSVGMPQSTVQTAVPQMFPVFPGNPGGFPETQEVSRKPRSPTSRYEGRMAIPGIECPLALP